MLNKSELSRFGSGMLTDVFIDRPECLFIFALKVLWVFSGPEAYQCL